MEFMQGFIITDLKDCFVVSDIGFVVNLTLGSSTKIAVTQAG